MAVQRSQESSTGALCTDGNVWVLEHQHKRTAHWAVILLDIVDEFDYVNNFIEPSVQQVLVCPFLPS
jgi:hypothetical protein